MIVSRIRYRGINGSVTDWCDFFHIDRDRIFDIVNDSEPHIALFECVVKSHPEVKFADFELVRPDREPTRSTDSRPVPRVKKNKIEHLVECFIPVTSSAGYWVYRWMSDEEIRKLSPLARNLKIDGIEQNK